MDIKQRATQGIITIAVLVFFGFVLSIFYKEFSVDRQQEAFDGLAASLAEHDRTKGQSVLWFQDAVVKRHLCDTWRAAHRRGRMPALLEQGGLPRDLVVEFPAEGCFKRVRKTPVTFSRPPLASATTEGAQADAAGGDDDGGVGGDGAL